MRPQLKDKTVTIPGVPWFEVLSIHQLSLPDNYCGMDLAQVEKYTALIRAGHKLEPVLVYEDDDNWWVIDGRHRFLATIIAGQDSIRAFVTNALVMI